MSKIKVNYIVNQNDDGAPEFSRGATVPPGQSFAVNGNVNVVGIMTASSLIGNGSGLTGLSIATQGTAIAFKRILSFDEYRS
jgi:hypothetical protein